MTHRIRSVVLLSAIVAAAVAVVGAASRSRAGLVVHEWGTFTSVAGAAGQAVDWTPLGGPQDLPCFVEHQPLQPGLLTSVQVKGRDIYGLLKLLSGPPSQAASTPAPAPAPLLPPPVMVAKVRMETPVLYFYTSEEATVRVKASFQQGVMSEWYPHATVPRVDVTRPLAGTVGTIEWPAVKVLPATNAAYPHDGAKSHYYAARDVDASPLQVGTQYEKFLFYRGLADFQPSLLATIGRAGEVTVYGAAAGATIVLFEQRHGHVAYRVAREGNGPLTLRRPEAGSVDALRAELVTLLTEQGLYGREAKAMVETWRDSWFEEGSRIFYLMPKARVDERLPLTISPEPAELARVFVGRIELITPEMKDDVERAVAQNDLDTLNSYGRFLDSIVLQIQDRPSIANNLAGAASALRAVASSHPQPAACR